MPSLEPPEDESIKTLYVGGLDARISEQDLRDHFYAHGEIESVRMVLQRACAFVTYTTREGAEKAAEELSNKLVIKGLRLKLMWGRPQAPKPETDASDEARQQAAVAHSGLLPRAVISQQQNQSHDQAAPMQYYNIPPPPQPERNFYPSMDPQRMGALISSQEGAPSGFSENKSQDKQPHGQHYAHQPRPPPHGQYHQQYYPPYGYMHPPPPPGPPPPYQQYPSPYAMPPRQPPPVNQQYQHSAAPAPAPSGSTPAGSVPSGSNSQVPAAAGSSGSAPTSSSS